jgi:hypothetical protein
MTERCKDQLYTSDPACCGWCYCAAEAGENGYCARHWREGKQAEAEARGEQRLRDAQEADAKDLLYSLGAP